MAVRSSSLRRAVAVLAFATVLVPACAANAAAYVFTVTGPNTASFTLNSSPTPDATGTGFFTVQNVPGTYNGTGVTFGQLTFFASGVASGGFFASGTALNLEGPQLFTGTLTNPTFSLGTFTLDDGNFTHPTYTLLITNGPVPEPATWAIMLLGFAAIGLSSRRLRHSAGVPRVSANLADLRG
jgi:hypothetical protein